MLTIATTTGENVGTVIGLILLAVTWVGPVVVCFLKGKPWTGIAGLFVGIVALFGMVRIAKPESWWFRKMYGVEAVRRKAWARHRKDVPYPADAQAVGVG